MTTAPAVIVKKGGFLAATATGFFTLLTVGVICATALGYRGMNLVSDHGEEVEKMICRLGEQLPKWRETMPPAVVEALDDHRDADFVKNLEIEDRLVERRGDSSIVLTVKNNGNAVVTFLALNIQTEDNDGVPLGVSTVWVATPFALDEPQFRGPLLPGTACKFSVPVEKRAHSIAKVNLTVREVRIANSPDATAIKTAAKTELHRTESKD